MLFGRLAAYRRAERVQLRVDRYAPGEADCSGALGVLQGAQPVLAARSSAVADSAAVPVDLPTAAGPRDLRALLRADSFLGVRCLVVPFDPAVAVEQLPRVWQGVRFSPPFVVVTPRTQSALSARWIEVSPHCP